MTNTVRNLPDFSDSPESEIMNHKQKRKHLEGRLSPQPAKMSRGEENMQDDLQGEDEILAPTQYYKVRDISYTTSEHLSYGDKFRGAETNKLPQYILHLPSRKRPLHQYLMGCPNDSFVSSSHVPFKFANNHLMTSVCTERKRVMNVYYMCVLTKSGIIIFEDMDGELEPPPKRISIAKLTFPEWIPPKVTLVDDTQYLLTNSEAHWDSEVQKGWEEAENASKPLGQDTGLSVKTPPWLVGLERGFWCMGCCSVFPTLESLMKHVERGIEEGFSCLTFHLAFNCDWEEERDSLGIYDSKNSSVSSDTQMLELKLFS
ncbi:protein FAM170A-like [Heterocephalus glaber]|uniref:Protein FAM170A-like n=1 Tax=Heterocephalus glaber TaxID=10181 RepID=A0AAX6P5S7_HETGA|nr:protein FAM170A-like [Heterocephalus glaber]